jgi:hypothetical protein
VPELDRVGQREHACESRRGTAHEVGGDDDLLALEAIGGDAAQQHKHEDRPGLERTDDAHRRRRIRELVHLPRERDDHDAIADVRDRASGPVESEVPHPEGRQDLRPSTPTA